MNVPKPRSPTEEEQRERDDLLRRLLHTPPQPRPKRDRGDDDKPTRNRAKRASGGKREPSA